MSDFIMRNISSPGQKFMYTYHGEDFFFHSGLIIQQTEVLSRKITNYVFYLNRIIHAS